MRKREIGLPRSPFLRVCESASVEDRLRLTASPETAAGIEATRALVAVSRELPIKATLLLRFCDAWHFLSEDD